MELKDIVCVSAVRTPMGKFGGSFRYMESYELGAAAIKGAIEKAGSIKEKIDMVFMGSTRQAGHGPNPARTAARLSGLDASVPASTVNMACPSGMLCMIHGANGIMLGDFRVVVSGGMECMSNIPYLLKGYRWDGLRFGDVTIKDGWSDSIDPYCNLSMGQTAELLVEKYNIKRDEQDEFALESHIKAARAQDNGWFDSEIIPVSIPARKSIKEESTLDKDECIRRNTSIEKLSRLKPAFKKDGTITAGNSCGLTDGASALILCSRDFAISEGLKPLFSIVSYSIVSVENEMMGIGPTVAIPAALKKAGMTLQDVDLIEVNEAFAGQVIACEHELKWNREKLNIHGGAIALGHPTGTSGVRIVVTLYYALLRTDKEIGVASLCGATGVSTAIVIKREN